VSPEYRQLLTLKHSQDSWGGAGKSHADEIVAFADALGAITILDYGCGRGTLKPAIAPRAVVEYDPGIPGKDHLPEQCDLLIATDVLEHIEPDRLDAVLSHMRGLCRCGAFFVIALSLSRVILPDGNNSHLIIRSPEWWLEKLNVAGFKIERSELRKGLFVWAR